MKSSLTQYQLYDLIENANLDLHNLTDHQRLLICYAAEPGQWIRATEMFLRGIDAVHTIPSDQVVTLQGICQAYREHDNLTGRQQMYVSSRLIEHWAQLGVEMRATILY